MAIKTPSRWIETTDGYIPAPENQQPTSLLHQQVLDTVDNFKISSFDAWAMDLFVTVGLKGDPTWKCTPNPNAFKFEFEYCGPRNRTLSARFHKGRVQVFLNQKWTPLVDYLEDEAHRNPCNPNRGANLNPEGKSASILRTQCGWWGANNKHFRLLDLPLELRREIYRQAAPQDAIEPYARHWMRGGGMPHVSYGNEMISNMLKCNKVVAKEMRDHMFMYLPMLFNHSLLLKKTLRENLDFPRKELTLLTLAFPTYRDFFHVFGLRARSNVTGNIISAYGSQSTPWTLPPYTLPSLKRLEIVIPSRETLSDLYFLAGGCQTATANMLLEIMWPWIEGQPLVVSGMVKKWQKKRWEEKAALAHKEYKEIWADSDYGGGVPVTQEDLDRYEGKKQCDDEHCSDCSQSDSESGSDSDSDDEEVNWYLPFVCQCRPPCLKDAWTNVDYVQDGVPEPEEPQSVESESAEAQPECLFWKGLRSGEDPI